MLPYPLGRWGNMQKTRALCSESFNTLDLSYPQPITGGKRTVWAAHRPVCPGPAFRILTTNPHGKTKLTPFTNEVTKAQSPKSPIQWVVTGSAGPGSPRPSHCPQSAASMKKGAEEHGTAAAPYTRLCARGKEGSASVSWEEPPD